MTNNNTTTQFVIKSLVVNVSLEIFYPPPTYERYLSH